MAIFPKISKYAELHIVVVLLGFTAILGKLINLPVPQLIQYRTLIATIGMALILLFTKSWQSISVKTLLKFIGTGIVIAIHWFLFFEAGRISNVAVSLIGLATSPLWVAIVTPLLYKTKMSLLEICLGLLVLLGLYLIFLTEIKHGLGLIYSIMSGFLAAVFSMLNSSYSQKNNALLISFYEMLGATLFFSLYILGNDRFLLPSFTDWLWLLLLGVLCSVYAFTAIVRLLKTMPTFAVNLVINLEPVYGIILAYFIFGHAEQMTWGFYAGSGLIISSVLGYQWSKYTAKSI